MCESHNVFEHNKSVSPRKPALFKSPFVKPHICYVLPPFERYSPTSGGALATIVLHQTRELTKRGYRVTILAPEFSGDKYSGAEIEFFKFEQREDLNIVRRFFSSKVRGRSGKYEWPYFEYYLEIIKTKLRAIKPDIVIVFNEFSSPLEIKAILPNARVIVYLHNEHPRIRQAENYFDENLDSTAQVWSVSNYLRDATKRAFPRGAAKIVTLYNGVDTQTFSPRLDEYQLPQLYEPVRVLYVGRTDATKGTDLVPRAVAALRAQGENVELTVAGSTWFYDHDKQNERPYMRELRAAMGAAGARYLGHIARPDLPAIFREADVACVPSRFNEPFGLTALEGMASGCAMIVSNRGGLPEFCAGAALIIEPDAPDDLTNALRRLVRDRALLARTKELGRTRALQYDWSVVVNRLEDLLKLSLR